MNIAPERAREACESCRKSHKKCDYDDNSTRCRRCERRNTPCSLFLTVETAAAVQQGPPTLLTDSAPDSWVALGTPHGSSASSTLSYPFSPQEGYYWAPAAFTGSTQEEYAIFQGAANQHSGDQPAMDQDFGSYGHNNVFDAPDST